MRVRLPLSALVILKFEVNNLIFIMPEYKILGLGILSWMIFLPILGLVITLLVPKSMTKSIKYISVFFTFLLVVLSVVLYVNYDAAKAGINSFDTLQFVERVSWIDVNLFGGIHIEYFVGLDGISITMIFLTAIVSLMGAIASFSVTKNEKGYYALYLFLVTGMLGVFCALDMFLFFIFWEVMLLPMYFLIGIWGGPRREYAAIKFF